MSYFSTAFDRWLHAHRGCTLQNLSDASTVPSSNLSRLRAGLQPMTLKAMNKLLPALEARSTRDAARALLIAYLRDETPDAFAGDIEVRPVGSTAQEDLPESDPLDLLALRWRERAEHDPGFAEMWTTLDGHMF